jgi:putative ATP-dependent endonuclease of OLD family|tara:strand:- start:3772 stop:5646 length:1875 start_codon:yes stop_codon:yes gene_type:complete
MVISKLYIKNFRGYAEQTIELHKDLNVIIGKNDVGKSTILEALEIFFNNNTIKIDVLDLNKKRADKEDGDITIQVSFEVDSKKSYTIDTVPTKLSQEYLLDSEGYLTIRKVWNASGKNITSKSLKTYIVSDYPSTKFNNPLICRKISELKGELSLFDSTQDTTSVNKTICSDIRKAIYRFSSINSSDLTETIIPIDAEDGKKIYDAIKVDLPLYFLFKADRENKDSDSEVQGPLKAITKSILSGMQKDLDELKDKIVAATEDVGLRTIEKLSEMNPEIANELTPTVSTKAWDSLFSFTFEDEDGIPINKRGSGVRRLILLNYFRAEAERQRVSEKPIIYALEEPETAQHPDWQKMLYNALVDLSEQENTQILLTTHSPSLGALVPTNDIIFIFRKHGQIEIESNDPLVLDGVTQSLGVMPNIEIAKIESNIKLIICLEGYTDVEFLKNISQCFDVDLKNHPDILIIPLGGGNLEHWENYKYLDRLSSIPQLHIYDRDVKKYRKIINKINQNKLHKAFQTEFYEIENYIHPSLYSQCYDFSDPFVDMSDSQWLNTWKDMNIPKELSAHLKECYKNGDRNLKEYNEKEIKRKFNLELSKELSADQLKDMGAYDEVNMWFEHIKTNI